MAAGWKWHAIITMGLLAFLLLAVVPPADASFEITGFDGSTVNEDGSSATQAGSHPFAATTEFHISSHISGGNLVPDANPRDIQVTLPPGFVGNPNAVPKCTQALFLANDIAPIPPYNSCPVDSQVGFVEIDTAIGGPTPTVVKLPVFNIVPPKGSPAVFGFNFVSFPLYLHAHVRTGGDYGVTAEMAQASQATPFVGAKFTLWGIPADPAHDPDRDLVCFPDGCTGSGQSISAPQTPFLTMPMDCAAGPLTTGLAIDSWLEIGAFQTDSFVSHLGDGTPAGVDGCSRLPFEPAMRVKPTSSAADSPTGLSVDLELPQNESPKGLAESYLKQATVTLPAGLRINPAAAEGLAGCTSAEADLHGSGPANCPGSSQIGTVELETPLLDHVVKGSVYAAAQKDNPFGTLLATYVSVDDPQTGVAVKLAGKVEADEQTGQLVATFDNNPQLPFSNLHLDFFGGSRAVLRTPSSCGTYTTEAKMSPWSAANPDSPTPSEVVTSLSKFAITSGPAGTPCGGSGFAPKLEAGTTNPVGGASSPFTLRVSREDGTQELSTISATLPKGLLASLRGIPYCSDAALGSVPTAEGTGAAQLADPSCPTSSQVGTVSVGAGAGPSPFYVNTGKAYLAGPYKGAPLSLAIITPALAGPFDLGNVVVRSALQVNPETTQVTAVSDPLPTILDGIPLDIRDVRVNVDRPEFTRNPTSCEEQQVTSAIGGIAGAQAHPSSRFEVGSCEALPFKPKLALKLKGKTKRTGHPALTATLTFPKGTSANTAKAQVGLPGSEFLDQGNIKTVCTRPQLAAHACPAGSVYGHATLVTPLLDQPLTGPVYLGTGYGTKLPMLVAELNGQIDVVVRGKIDTDKQKGIRATFAQVPDAPFSKFTLAMKGGPKKGLIENSVDLCKERQKATLTLAAHNGKRDQTRPALGVKCPGKR
jgi:hypothetical protein